MSPWYTPLVEEEEEDEDVVHKSKKISAPYSAKWAVWEVVVTANCFDNLGISDKLCVSVFLYQRM